MPELKANPEQAALPPANTNVPEGELDFNNPNIKTNYRDFSKEKFRRFRGEAQDSYRIFMFEGKAVLRRCHSHNKCSRRCLSYLGACPACDDEKVKAWTEQFGCNVFVYPTDLAGEIVAPGKEGRYPMGIYFWKFGSDKYVDIKAIVKQWGSVVGYDLFITTKEPDFQKLSIQPCKECLCQTTEAFKLTLEKMKKTDCYPVEKVLVKEVTAAKMVDDFGLDPRILLDKPKLDAQEIAVKTVATESPVQEMTKQAPQQVTQVINTAQPVQQKAVRAEPETLTPPQAEKPKQPEEFFFTVDDNQQSIKVTRSQLENLVNAKGLNVPVMAGNQEGGWKKASDFGFIQNIPAQAVATLPPPPSVPLHEDSPTNPVPPKGGDFDKLFANLG